MGSTVEASAMRHTPFPTRCRDDKCPNRWECMRWAPPWDSHVSSGPVSYTTTLRDRETGECAYQVRGDEEWEGRADGGT